MTTTPTLSRGGAKVVADGVGRLPFFSHASIVGDLILVSGTLGTLGGGVELAIGGAGAETRRTLENIRSILQAAGADLADVAKVSVYVTDMADFAAMNEAYAEFFPPADGPPARITLEVAGLALGAKVEIECIATRPAG
jgi:reactive intermediate/imine deaminase